MKTITTTTTIYKFDELSEEGKQNAIQKNWDINLHYGWWEYTYGDAKNVGIKINGFDIDREAYCQIDIKDSCYHTADLIIKYHGEVCDTYKTAKQFIDDYDALVKKYSDGKDTDRVTEENEYEFDNEVNDLEEEFKKSIAEDYRIILQKEFEYLTSEEAIIETIKANDYDFTDKGDIY
jgi:hypothetical protein